jgi:hypothetical protein
MVKYINKLTGVVHKYNLRSSKKLLDYKKEIKYPSYTWNDFNNYHLLNNINRTIEQDYVSGTTIKNYLLNDPLLDWLNLYNKSTNNNHKSKTNNILCELGNQFEEKIYNYYLEKYPETTVLLIKEPKSINLHNIDNYQEQTIKYMNLGYDMIFQAPLFNNINYTYGVSDILVRSDKINQIFNRDILTDQEQNIPAPNINKNYHYLVIDIKWTTVYTLADNILIKNTGRFSSYKGQLAIYTAALGLLQGYTPDYAFIMGKSYKSVNRHTHDYLNNLGKINYKTHDNYFIKRTYDAISWIREVRYLGKNWSYNPPSRIELHPNMSNKYDQPYKKLKKSISKSNHEITQLWMITVKNRLNAINSGINRWSHSRLNARILGINPNHKLYKTVNQILRVNKGSSVILPKKIKNNDYNWKSDSNIDFYVDFEAIVGALFDDQENLIYMIGVGYIKDDEWIYMNFTLENYDRTSENIMINNFINYLQNITDNIRIYHWGNAEKSMFKSCNKRHNNIWNDFNNKITWIDFCKIFRDEPITIKDCFSFKLKDIGTSMYNHKLIDVIWEDDGPKCGFSAMYDAINYYRNKKDIKILDKIKKYNEIDCKIVYKIVKYLRLL